MREKVSLAIYNSGSALIRERRRLRLDQGINQLDIEDVPATINATSVTLSADGLSVLEQNYQYDLVSRDALLQRYLDETIEIVASDGVLFTGKLLAAQGQDILIQQSDGQVIASQMTKIRNVRFPSLPGGLLTRPTLRWLLHSKQAGEQIVDLTYLAEGIKWIADYNLLLAADKQTLDLNGWVTLENHCGTAFEDAQVKLIAGNIRRIQSPRPEQALMELRAGGAASNVDQRELFEYQLYEIQRPVTVANNEAKQVEFVRGEAVPAEVYYVVDELPSRLHRYHRKPFTDPAYITKSTSVEVWLTFTTAAEEGLGADLPAGRMRVYQEDQDGSAILVGEGYINHTPQGERVDLELGAAFDLVAERKQTDFQQPGKNIIEEAFEIRLRNRKDSDTVTIRVRETLYRWRQWEIIDSSAPYTRQDYASIEFRLDVPPGGETSLNYRVRYQLA